MALLADTSVIVRYLVQDPQDMGERAARLIESQSDLTITETVLAETGYVLHSVYGIAREVRIDLLIALIQRDNITVRGLNKEVVIEGLLKCRPSGRISVPDALIWAGARCDAPSTVYSFDRRFPADGIDLREPL